MRRLLLFALLGLAVLPSAAAAKSYVLPRADITVTVAPDSSLLVEEKILFAYSGEFSGAYRDVPLRPGETIDRISVIEESRQARYRPGASAELGSSGAPDTFGVARLSDRMRVVWHYRATNESRTFTIAYRLRGVAVAYDDILDVNLQVWGDEWPVGVTTLEARRRATRHRIGAAVPRVGSSSERARHGRARSEGRQAESAVRPSQTVRRAAGDVSATARRVDRRRPRRAGPRSRENRRRGAGGCRCLRARPAKDPRRGRSPAAHDRVPPVARRRPGAARDHVRMGPLWPRAPHRLRPRVRAGTAVGPPSRARTRPAARA